MNFFSLFFLGAGNIPDLNGLPVKERKKILLVKLLLKSSFGLI
jgi:hypothetical protein